MSVDERDRRPDTAGREAGHAPRSGGRTTGQRGTRDTARPDGSAGGYATAGTAALSVAAVRVWDSTDTPAGRPAPQLKVAPPPPVAAPRAPFVALVLLVVVAGVLGILVINVKTNENAFRIDILQDSQRQLDLQQQQLEKQIAEFESPGNLGAAGRKLGLVRTGPPAFIRLQDGRIIGISQPGGGPPANSSQSGTGSAPGGR